MPSYAPRHVRFIGQFPNANKRDIRGLVQEASSGELKGLCECVQNLCNGNIKCDKKQLQAFRRYKQHIHRIAYGKGANNTLEHKRQVLIQHGGFLPQLAQLAIPLLAGIIPEIIKKF
jgi:hypothetical protein